MILNFSRKSAPVGAQREFGTHRKARSGFTLIELLVVIAIIAILAAILFPVFARARDNGRRAACQSNLKQIGLALIQYSQDYSERMPPVNQGLVPDAANPGQPWMELIQPYAKSRDVLNCPDFETEYAGGISAVSYGMNAANYQEAAGLRGPGNGGMKLSSIAVPTSTIWVGDTNGPYYVGWKKTTDAPPSIQPDDGNGFRFLGLNATGGDGAYIERHLATVCLLYCDGHVKSVKLDNVKYNDFTVKDNG